MADEKGNTTENGLPTEIQDNLEALIRAAGSYVVPSEDHRPKTLFAAHEVWKTRRRSQLYYRVLVVASCCLALAIHTIHTVSYLRESIYVSPEEFVQRGAEALVDDRSVGPDWAVQESYSRYRAAQSRQFQSLLFEDTQAGR